MRIPEVKKSLEYMLVPGHTQPITPFLWGKPGIGKSQLLRQYCAWLEETTGEKWHFIDLRMSQLESADIRGLPVPDLENDLSKWLPPEFLPFDGIDKWKGTNGILLLDEFNRARSDVFQAAFQLVLDRQVGMHTMLDSWFIVAAGNYGFEKDQTDVNEMDSALKNRFSHIDVEMNINDWLEWARSSGIHRDVIGFITAHNRYLYMDGTQDNQEGENMFVTPRSWEAMSNVLKQNKKIDPHVINAAMGKTIIQTASGAFGKYIRDRKKISAKDVLFKFDEVKDELKNYKRDDLLSINADIQMFVADKTADLSDNKQEEVLKNLLSYMDEFLNDDNGMSLLRECMAQANSNNNEIMRKCLKNNPELSARIIDVMYPEGAK